MPYTSNDLRSQLAPTQAGSRGAGATAAPQYFEFAKLDPDEVSDLGTRSWYVRSQTCCVVFSMAQRGDRLVRDDQPDEYVILLPSTESSVVVTANGDRQEVSGRSVVVVPAGKSEVAVEATGVVVRLFSSRAEDLLERCRNADAYAEPDANVAPFEPWPDPPEGRAGPRVRARPDRGRQGSLRAPAALQHRHGELLLPGRRTP